VIYSLIGPLPQHRYCWIDTTFTHAQPQTPRWQPAVWFGLVSFPGRAWGCTVLLESGAVYRNIPPHALAFCADPQPLTLREAQTWDCYHTDFSAVIYPYLDGLRAQVRTGETCQQGCYLFSVAPVGDGFSAAPDQAKEFHFLELDTGGLTIQPTNRVVYEEKSFTVSGHMPVGLKLQTDVYSCE